MSQAEATIRSFIAIELPPEIKDALKGAQDMLRKSGADVKWVRTDGIHLTLKFLGEIRPDMVESIREALGAALSGCGGLQLVVNGAGAFPNPRSPRVVWAGLTGEMERLADIQRMVGDACEGLGFEREKRPFKPHLTLGRVRSQKGAGRLAGMLDEAGGGLNAEFTADAVSLMKSELRPAGAVYTELARIGL